MSFALTYEWWVGYTYFQRAYAVHHVAITLIVPSFRQGNGPTNVASADRIDT